MSKQSIKSKLIAAFAAAGISASAAYVAYDLTYPSEGLVQEVYLDPVIDSINTQSPCQPTYPSVWR